MVTAVPVGVGQEGVTGIPDSVPPNPESVEAVEPESPPPASVWVEPGPPPESFEPEPPPEPPEPPVPGCGPPFATLVSAPPPSLCGDPLPDELPLPEPQPETASIATRRHPANARAEFGVG